ncbi:hypothetical protein A9G41_08640 [Gilliamella sp. Nev5-1]|uniref:hypothetical protein n=1 Tax=unclassified Gilliamella TaxID=2685620 RepID=UPI00080D984C|nr:hypothetical protein [Gilliamella apicola]OCG59735.1 hypothetical protein A9G40_06220 [Gilliamella apicola]OCG68238.1 hypothetical protein A9G41_08640 [Gilliamella apicola]
MYKYYDLILNKLKTHDKSLLTRYGKLYPVRMNFAYHNDAYQRKHGVDAYMDMLNLSDLTLLSNHILSIVWVMAFDEQYGFYFPAMLYFDSEQYANYNVIMKLVTDCWKNQTDGNGINVEQELAKNTLSELAQLSWEKQNPLRTLYINNVHTFG